LLYGYNSTCFTGTKVQILTLSLQEEYLALRKKYGAEGVYVSLFDKVCNVILVAQGHIH
jgi:hypothetical protein